VKFDGWRAQLHVENGSATLYSKNGTDYTKRFRSLRPTIERLPVKNAILDCELVACGETGMRCFKTLMELDNKAPGPLPLVERKALLADLVAMLATSICSLALLQTCQRINLEGIVSKRKECAYRSGPTRDWLKIKTAAWRAANRARYEFFAKHL
jgi:bifunctional non-homologous end joining protein LigD